MKIETTIVNEHFLKPEKYKLESSQNDVKLSFLDQKNYFYVQHIHIYETGFNNKALETLKTNLKETISYFEPFGSTLLYDESKKEVVLDHKNNRGIFFVECSTNLNLLNLKERNYPLPTLRQFKELSEPHRKLGCPIIIKATRFYNNPQCVVITFFLTHIFFDGATVDFFYQTLNKVSKKEPLEEIPRFLSNKLDQFIDDTIPDLPIIFSPKNKNPKNKSQVSVFISKEKLSFIKEEASRLLKAAPGEPEWISTNDVLSALLLKSVVNFRDFLPGTKVEANVLVNGRKFLKEYNIGMKEIGNGVMCHNTLNLEVEKVKEIKFGDLSILNRKNLKNVSSKGFSYAYKFLKALPPHIIDTRYLNLPNSLIINCLKDFESCNSLDLGFGCSSKFVTYDDETNCYKLLFNERGCNIQFNIYTEEIDKFQKSFTILDYADTYVIDYERFR